MAGAPPRFPPPWPPPPPPFPAPPPRLPPATAPPPPRLPPPPRFPPAFAPPQLLPPPPPRPPCQSSNCRRSPSRRISSFSHSTEPKPVGDMLSPKIGVIVTTYSPSDGKM